MTGFSQRSRRAKRRCRALSDQRAGSEATVDPTPSPEIAGGKGVLFNQSPWWAGGSSRAKQNPGIPVGLTMPLASGAEPRLARGSVERSQPKLQIRHSQALPIVQQRRGPPSGWDGVTFVPSRGRLRSRRRTSGSCSQAMGGCWRFYVLGLSSVLRRCDSGRRGRARRSRAVRERA